MWKLFQLMVVFLVAASNIHWQWTENTTAAVFFGWLAALLITAYVVKLQNWLTARRGRAELRQPRH